MSLFTKHFYVIWRYPEQTDSRATSPWWLKEEENLSTVSCLPGELKRQSASGRNSDIYSFVSWSKWKEWEEMPCYCCMVACFCTSHLKEEILIFQINLIPKETNAEEISPEHLKNLNPARQLRWCLISQHYDRASLSAPPLSMCKCQNKSLFPFCWATPHHRHGQKLFRRFQT